MYQVLSVDSANGTSQQKSRAQLELGAMGVSRGLTSFSDSLKSRCKNCLTYSKKEKKINMKTLHFETGLWSDVCVSGCVLKIGIGIRNLVSGVSGMGH